MQNIPLTFDEHEVIKFFPILYLCLSSPVEIDCFLHKYMVQFTHLDLNYFSFYPNCQLLKCPFKKFASFIVEITVNENNFLFSFINLHFFLATNLQTAYIEFNTVQEAEQWMNLTQVQTKKPKYCIILVSIYWWECRL